LGIRCEIWQRGFSDVRIVDAQSFQQHRGYIEDNPVKAGLANSAEEYAFGSAYLKKKKHAGAEAHDDDEALTARLKSCPDTSDCPE
jgi:putative transposase